MISIKTKEVIDNLKLISGVIPIYSEGRYKGLTDIETETLALESISQAIELLEKQIPKKINETPAFQSYFSAGDESECICPSCEFELNIEEQVSYCSECGQRLDWED